MISAELATIDFFSDLLPLLKQHYGRPQAAHEPYESVLNSAAPELAQDGVAEAEDKDGTVLQKMNQGL